jgi:hypothetical protein
LDRGSAYRKAAAYTQNNTNTQTSMPRVGFGPSFPVFDRAKTVHALNRSATVMGRSSYA